MNLKYIILGGFLAGLASCNHKEKPVPAEPKIAKTVPLNFIRFTDPALHNHQDTLFYHNVFFTGYRYALYKSGDTAWLQSFFNGVEEGKQIKWYPNRQLAEERFYINGKKEGIHRNWWPDGKPKMYYEADGDEYNGLFREWYASGRLGKEFHYVNGHEEGSERLWWNNGTVRANYVIRNGRRYGLLGTMICVNPYDSITKTYDGNTINPK